MIEAPETILASVSPARDGWMPNISHPGGSKEFSAQYRRADLPATDAQALANPKVKALVEAAAKADRILSAFSDGREIYESAIADLRTALAAIKEGQNDE